MNTHADALDGTDFDAFIRDHGPRCLIIARHGETAWNAEGRLQGQQDILLNGRGQGQAANIADLLREVPLLRIHSSTLVRCRATAQVIATANIGKLEVNSSDLLRETTLGILEGEMKDSQSTPELTRHYQEFSRDEINTRVPGGENLHDVYARVARFFADQDGLLKGPGVRLIVGHRNLNKMILKHILGLSFEQGFRVEQEHQRLYLYFGAPEDLWSCWIEAGMARLTKGYVSTTGSSYA
jgi:probable phosphoglycerate mutase